MAVVVVVLGGGLSSVFFHISIACTFSEDKGGPLFANTMNLQDFDGPSVARSLGSRAKSTTSSDIFRTHLRSSFRFS